MLAPVCHRHLVLTIPRLLRPLFRRRRELLTELGRAAAEATTELVRRGLGDEARPGVVVSIATAGDLVQWHPHVHLLTTEGGRIGETIAPTNKLRLEDTAAYLVRNPLSLRKLVYLDGERAVIYRSRMNPSLGRNFEALDPLEWLARMSDHIPDSGQHRTLFYGEYSNRVRGSGHPDDREAQAGEAPEPRKRCSPTWARLIARVYQINPLVCTRCGQRMSLIAFVTDQMAVQKILDHIGLSSPEAAKPPPPGREVLRVAEHGDGWHPATVGPSLKHHSGDPEPRGLIVPMAGPRPLGSRRSATACLPGSGIPLASADAPRPGAPWCQFGRIGRSGRPASPGARRARRSKGLSVTRTRAPPRSCSPEWAPGRRSNLLSLVVLGLAADEGDEPPGCRAPHLPRVPQRLDPVAGRT